MKKTTMLASALLATMSAAACGRSAEYKTKDELLAASRRASHPSAELLVRLPLAQQELLLGPPAASANRARALVAPTDLTLGPVDAPVVLIAFVDFGAQDGDPVAALEAVQRAHSKDVRVAIRPVVSNESGSVEIARAVIAANEQGKGWEVAACAARPGGMDAVLGIEGCTAIADLDFRRYAKDLSLAPSRLTENARSANHLAVEKLPTLFLNGYRIRGIPPQDELDRGVKATIDHAWAVAGSEHLQRGQIYPHLMRTASIPAPLQTDAVN